MIPGFMISAPGSGSGKTLITCALIGALKKRGYNVCSFKCGPDYIDPMFHKNVLKVPSENLDAWFVGEKELKGHFKNIIDRQIAEHGAQIAVIEGAMGVFDGMGGISEDNSAYHIASMINCPIILTVDVHGMGVSMAALIKGFLDHDKTGLIKGIVLNRISAPYYERIKPVLEKELGSGLIIGYFPNVPDLKVESRHLGLKMPWEVDDITEKLDRAADLISNSVDIDKLLELSQCIKSSYDEDGFPDNVKEFSPVKTDVTLAVAKDEAFCFYYEANLRALEAQGIRIRYFSPLKDERLPEGISGLLLGGGYPELYAKELSANTGMLKDIKEKLASGLPCLAECGGFMYLHSALEEEGRSWPMVGAVSGTVRKRDSLVRFGYVEIKENTPCFLEPGSFIRGHEFHYYDSDENGESCTAIKPYSDRTWQCIHEGEGKFWGFAHLYYPSAPEFVPAFAEQMRSYKIE